MKKLLFCLLSTILIAGTVQAAPVEFNGHYYEVVADTSILWSDANTASIGMSGYLATITTSSENDFIQNLLSDPSGINSNWGWWIGGSDADIEGDWKYTGGIETGDIFWSGGLTGSSVSPYSYENWRLNEPNNDDDVSGPAGTDQVSYMQIDYNGEWRDRAYFSEKSIGYVVEYDTNPIPVPAAVWLFGSGLLGIVGLKRKLKS